MTSMRSGKFIIVATALVLALGACGGSSSKSLNVNAGGGNNPLKNLGGNNGKSGNNSIDSLLSQSNKKTFKVTYTGSGGDSFTVINKPPLAAYVQKDSAEYQTSDNKLVTCQGSGSTATCTSVGGAGAGNIGSILTLGLGSYGSLFKTYAGLLGNVKTTSETIAGRSAECVTVDISKFEPTKTGSVEYCVDKDLGIALRIKSTNGNKTDTAFEATNVSTSVSDSDVTPPVKPQELTIPSYTSTP